MQILASCSFEKSKTFNGKLILPNEDEKKPDRVYLNIVVDKDLEKNQKDKLFSEVDKSIVKSITFLDDALTLSCPEDWKGKVFNETNLDVILNDACYPTEVEGVTTLVRLPKGYSNMKMLKEVSEKYPNIRFIGGYLLKIPGVNIGRFEQGKDKMSIIYDDMYDTFVEVDLDDLSGMQEIVKKTRRKAEGIGVEKVKSSKPKKEKKAPKRFQAFNKLFGGEEEEDF